MLFESAPVQLATDVWLLKGFANSSGLLKCIHAVAASAPFRHYTVASGQSMSVAMTSCGELGWTSGPKGYAYLPHDPQTRQPWPPMPDEFKRLGAAAASAVDWPPFRPVFTPDFTPDSCLINRYAAGASMGLHQDRDEQDLSAPIVSVSIGASCKFMLGGLTRKDPVQSVELHDGDVMVWGRSARLVFHGVRPLPRKLSTLRYNLTFRKAG